MSSDADVIVVGGGPAGCAAAIWCALSGMSVVQLGTGLAPSRQPGETLHPGIAPIFRQLGVLDAVTKASPIRYADIIVNWGGMVSTLRLGGDGSHARGFQILRNDLNEILLSRAAVLGVTMDSRRAEAPADGDRRVLGVNVGSQDLCSRFVIDASGGNWLRRHMDVGWTRASRRLVARYGYATGRADGGATSPMLVADHQGWVWTAPVSSRLLQWTRLTFLPARDVEAPPHLADLPSIGESRAANVTWRWASRPAGPGYFLVGDAASVLDPASGRGVLHALMSAMMAAHLIRDVLKSGLTEPSAAARFTRWTHDWFQRDARQLTQRYALLDTSWRMGPLPDPASSSSIPLQPQDRSAQWAIP